MKKENIIFGLHPVIEAVKSKKNIDKIFLQKGLQGTSAKELIQLAKKENISISQVPIEKLNRLINKTHQGVVAQISPITFYDFEQLVAETLEKEEAPLFLILDQLSDVRNFGAIIRTAACTGVNGIIVQKKGGAPVNADTVKTSAGAIFKIPICKVDHIKDAIYYLQASDIKTIAATEKTTATIYETNMKQPLAIVMGNEGKGISPAILKIVDYQAKLPMKGEISSLNVSVACGVFLYEAVRQRSF